MTGVQSQTPFFPPIYRKLSQEEMTGPDRADAASLSAPPLLSSFLRGLTHQPEAKRSADVDWDTVLGRRDCFCQSEGLGQGFIMTPSHVFKLIWDYSLGLSSDLRFCSEMTVKTERGWRRRRKNRDSQKKNKKKTSQVRDGFSQPTRPLSDSAELCVVKKKK